jgi:hypothetical protein
METHPSPYQPSNAGLYSPLSGPDSIRILTLFECDDKDDDIECYLTELCLSDVNTETEGYTALSYVWGELKFSHEIWLGDQRFLIGANLDSALRHLRRRDRPIRLWVDAVCINQDDLMEKTSQVQQMRNVFSAASETIIWLGPSEGNTATSAWNFLERHSAWALDDQQEVDRTIPAKLEEQLISFRGELRDVEVDILSRPWFGRLWVVQEAVLSQTLCIQSGHRRIPWNDFSNTVLGSERHEDRYGFSMRYDDPRHIVQFISLARREYMRQQGLDEPSCSSQFLKVSTPSLSILHILELLHSGRYLQASDARDKIFGFLGIATGIDANDTRFSVDYTLSPRSLYTHFARSLVEANNSLEILSYVDFPGPLLPRPTVETPSWAPCWDYESPAVMYCKHHRGALKVIDTIPAETKTEIEARRRRVSNSHIVWSHFEIESDTVDSMEVSGRIIGRIKSLTKRIMLHENDHILFKYLLGSFEDENERFALSMALWVRKLTSTNYGIDLRADQEFIDDARFDGVAWEVLDGAEENDPHLPNNKSRPNHLGDVYLHITQASLGDPKLPVHGHLHDRVKAAADWSITRFDQDIPGRRLRVTHNQSIVDGRKLAVCGNRTFNAAEDSGQATGQLVLVPASAKEGDAVIQISGARVPFVVRGGYTDWMSSTAGKSMNSDKLPKESNVYALNAGVFQGKLVGECLLNRFEELAEDDMDTRFRLV